MELAAAVWQLLGILWMLGMWILTAVSGCWLRSWQQTQEDRQMNRQTVHCARNAINNVSVAQTSHSFSWHFLTCRLLWQQQHFWNAQFIHTAHCTSRPPTQHTYWLLSYYTNTTLTAQNKYVISSVDLSFSWHSDKFCEFRHEPVT